MAGYSRQSVADIIANAVIKAAPVNAEYNAIRDAFAFATGHKHDGSSTEGAYVPLIADTDALNKVVVDTANNRIGIFTEVSAAAVEQVRFQDGAIVPVTDNDIDLGASGTKFKNLYVNGIASIGSITLSGGTIDDTVIGGTTPNAGTFTTLTATTVDLNGGNIDGTIIGATTPAAADFTTMDASGNATIGGTLGVTGVTTLGTANITSVDLDSGAIDNTTIGAATPAAGTFTTLTANTSLTAATADINGGTLDGVVIGGTSSAAATVTDLTATGTSTLTTVDINGGAIDGTTIGASSAAAGSFTTVSTSGQATLATADINGGTIDNATIGATTPAAITGTTITGTSFVGPVTGNVTGNLTGNVTGDLTGDVTGNITSTGSSSFNNVTIDGTLNMNAGTTATITNLTSPTNTNDAATKGYVDTEIANLVDSAPGTLDTLNELAAALDDDPNFSTTITNSIATKLPLAGGTMTGAIAMSTNKITGLGDPTAAQDAMTKAYADATYLALSGGTMTGAIDMGSQKITTTYTPTNAADLTTKTYVDTILGSGEDAVAAAAAAATSEANAATSETNAANSATAAAASATSAAASYDSFDDRYLGAKATAPTLDNDGDALVIGALYFNTTTNIMNVYSSGGWQSAGSAVNGTSDRQTYTATSGQTVFAATYDAGYVDVYLNGVKLLAGTDFTATNGTSITLASGAAVDDIVDIVAYGTFVLADHLTETQSDAKYVEVAGDTMTGNLSFGDNDKAIFGAGSDLQIYHDGSRSIIQDNGTGNLRIQANNLELNNADNSENYLFAANNGAVTLYYDNAEKLNTTSTGVDITGTLTSDGLTVDGNARIEEIGAIAKLTLERGGTANSADSAAIDMLETNSGSEGANFGDLGTNGFRLKLDGSANDFLIQSGTANVVKTRFGIDRDTGDISFYEDTGTTAKFFWDASTESLGIGTTSPAGGIDATTASSDAYFFKGSHATTTNFYITNTNATSGNTANLYLAPANGVAGSYISSIAIEDFSVSANRTADLAFYTRKDGTFGERMRIDSSGNVGIGTSSPNNYSGYTTLTINNGTNGGVIEVSQNSTIKGQFYYDGTQTRLRSNVSTALAFDTNNQEAMRIDSSGNVGINNTSPNTKLDIIGSSTNGSGVVDTLRLRNTGATINDGPRLQFTSGTSTSGAAIGSQGKALNSADLVFYAGGNTERMRILAGGGITFNGDTAAANALDDYEEGTWTPSFSSTNATFSYGAQAGYYLKIGGMVHAQFYLRATASGTTSNSCYITNLPFASQNINALNQWGGSIWFSGSVDIQPLVNNNTSTVSLWKKGTVAIATAAEAASNYYIVGHVSYRAN